MNRMFVIATKGPEGRQEVARSVRAGKFTTPRATERSGGPAHGRAVTAYAMRRAAQLVSALRAFVRALVMSASPRSNNRGYFLTALRACSATTVLLFATATFAEQPPAASRSQSSDSNDPPNKSAVALEGKRQEVEGFYRAAQEQLSAIEQQIKTPNSALTAQERVRLEAEQAKLRVQMKSYSEQLELIKRQFADADKAPPFAASLLLIKADWSQSPAAKEIEADLRKTLRGELVPPDQLQTLPASGPAILFPTESAAIYAKDHYAGLLAWLRAKELVLRSEPFDMAQYETVTPRPDGTNMRRTGQHNVLAKDLDFLGLTYPSQEPDQALVARKLALTWVIEHDLRLRMTRTLRSSEKPRGEDRFIDRGMHDQCNFNREALSSGDVLIVQAFPSSNDRVFRVAAAQKGFMALVVVEGYPPNLAPAVEPRLMLPDKVERLKVRKDRSAEAHLMIEPRLSPPPTKTNDIESASGFTRAGVPSGADPHRYRMSNEVMIRWSEANDAAWGFSKSLGRWAKQEINPPADKAPGGSEPATFIVGDNVAVWRVGSSYYAYSGQTGRWDVLRLPEGRAPKPLVYDNLVFVNDTDNDYAFAASTGRWSSPKGSAISTRDDAAAEGQPDGTVIKVFTLRHAKATDAHNLVNQLFARDIHSAAADERSNSLIVRGPSEQLNIIFAILTRLDEDFGGNQAARSDKQQTAWPKGEGGMSGTMIVPAPSSQSVAELTKQYNDKEQQALKLARQIRELKPAPEAHKQAIQELTASLRKAVGEAFAARQALHHAEVAQLQQRIASIQRSVATRDKLSDKIIEVRVNDLLNPELQWESTSRLPSGTSPGQPPRLPSSTLPPSQTSQGVPGLAKIDLASAREYRDKLRERWSAVQQLYRGGRVPYSDALQAAQELAQAELDASANPADRQVARKQAVELIKAIKAIVDPKASADVEPIQSKLAVDAALIKAQAELAAEQLANERFEPVPVHWTSRQTDQIIRNVLGVRVQEIAPQSVAKYGYKGGLLVDEVSTEPEPSLLREGDIILGLHLWETKSADELAWVIMQPISKNVAVLNPRDRTAAETAVIRVLRDGEPLRFEIKLPPLKVELNRANWPRLTGSSPATKNAPPKSTEPGSSPASPASTIVVGAGGDAATLRSPDDFRRNLSELESILARLKARSPSAYPGKDEEEKKKQWQEAHDRNQRDLAFLREEYAAQIRLLELELQDASSAVDAAAQLLKQTSQEFESGHSTRGNVIAQERAAQEARRRLHRAQTLLDLYRKADPKNSPSPPAELPTSPARQRE